MRLKQLGHDHYVSAFGLRIVTWAHYFVRESDCTSTTQTQKEGNHETTAVDPRSRRPHADRHDWRAGRQRDLRIRTSGSPRASHQRGRPACAGSVQLRDVTSWLHACRTEPA